MKLENIYLDDNCYPRIGDFGLAKKTDDEMKSNSCNKGSFDYMAPEILGPEIFLKAGDIYAFSMIVFKIMTNGPILKTFGKLGEYNLKKKSDRRLSSRVLCKCSRLLCKFD